MARIAAIGAEVLVRGYGLAGALVLPADSDDEVRIAWRSLPGDVAVVLLTRSAADALSVPRADGGSTAADQPLVAVIPG